MKWERCERTWPGEDRTVQTETRQPGKKINKQTEVDVEFFQPQLKILTWESKVSEEWNDKLYVMGKRLETRWSRRSLGVPNCWRVSRQTSELLLAQRRAQATPQQADVSPDPSFSVFQQALHFSQVSIDNHQRYPSVYFNTFWFDREREREKEIVSILLLPRPNYHVHHRTSNARKRCFWPKSSRPTTSKTIVPVSFRVY